MKYIGNIDKLNQIRIAYVSAQHRNDAVPHMLFAGAAGCGKTTLAKEVARKIKCGFLQIAPESLSDQTSIMDVLERLDHNGYDRYGNRVGKITPSILFVDEIHRMSTKGQEIMGIVMEELLIESKLKGKYHWIPKFSFIGATTEDGGLTKPFRDRFKYRFVFKPYEDDDMLQILTAHAERLRISLTPQAMQEICRRSRGVPRIAVTYLERVRDVAISERCLVVTSVIAEKTFKELHVDSEGLTEVEIEILKALYEAKEPIGLDNLSIMVNESPKTLKTSTEPYLLQKGLILRTGSGRKITDRGVSHLEKAGHLGVSKTVKVDITADYRRK